MAFAVGAAVTLPTMDGLVKWLAVTYPVALIAWMRFGVMTALLVALNVRALGRVGCSTDAPLLQGTRALLAVLATALFYAGLQRMPLAECTAIMALAPALSALIGRVWLKERTDRRCILGAILGVAGVLLIFRPSSGLLTGAVVLPVGAALAFAGFLATTRALAHRDPPHVTTLLTSSGAFLSFSAVIAVAGIEWPPSRDLGWFLLVGTLGAAGQLMVAHAYRHGSTHLVGPLNGLCLPVTIGVGWCLFGQVPDRWSLAGIAVVLAAGILVAIGPRPPVPPAMAPTAPSRPNRPGTPPAA